MPIYEKFIGRSRDSFVSLKDCQENFKIIYDNDFNYAYDVVDVLGTEKPDKLALLYVSNEQEEMHLTFGDMKRLSDKAANYFVSQGMKKGDPVLLILKRSYLFWVITLALNKIGAIMVPASNMLKGKDYVYRCNKAKIKYAVITGDDNCTEYFDDRKDEYETIEKKFVTKHKAVEG